MKKILLVFIIYLIFLNRFSAQKIAFRYEKDSTKISKKIENLSKEVLKNYTDKDKKFYFNNLFRLQLSAKQYDLGLKSLDSIRLLYAENYGEFHKVVGIHYEVYAKIKSKKSAINDTLKVVETITDNLLSKVSNVTKEDSYSYFDIDVKNAEESFKTNYEKKKSKDSISIKDAISLIRSHLYLQIGKLISKSSKIYIKNQLGEKYIIKDSLFIKTRDNGKLSAVIVRKKEQTKPLPVILTFSIYPSPYDIDEAKLATAYGYIGVTVYTRGKRFSNDSLKPFEYDGQDVYDAIDWISKQPWCNGKVGMYGGSYLGFAQWASTKKLHPALKTIVPMVSVGPGIDYPMYNNVFMSYMLRWIYYVENNKFTDDKDFNDEEKWNSLYLEWFKKGLAFKQLDSLSKKPNKTFQKWLEHPSYDSYWQNMMPFKNDFSKIDIPVLTFTGYYDSDQQGALHYYKQHHKYNANANHYLVIGPYDHGGAQGFPDKILNGYKIDSVAEIIRQIPLSFKWFDHILKDSIKPTFIKDKVNYQVMGTNKWESKASIKEITNDSLLFYLDNNFDLKDKKRYRLILKKPKKRAFVDDEINFLDRSSYFDFQKKPEKILDTILRSTVKTTFISKPFDDDFELNGSFSGNIDVIINKKDVDISIKLIEITPEGKYFHLSTYLGRASYAKNRSVRNLLKVNQKETIPIKNASFTSKLIKKGSRLLLVLSVNKNPYWQINYGTGKDVSTETIKDAEIPLKIKWLNSSFINIPIFKD